MQIVRQGLDGVPATMEHDVGQGAPSGEEVRDRAEDEGAEDEADHGEGEQVRDVVGLKWRRRLLSLARVTRKG